MALWWNWFFSNTLMFDRGHNIFFIQCDNCRIVDILTHVKISSLPRSSVMLIYMALGSASGFNKGGKMVTWVPTNAIPTDGFTEPLRRQKHEAFVKLIGSTDAGDLKTTLNRTFITLIRFFRFGEGGNVGTGWWNAMEV
ncbi:hypothetical protein ACJ72_01710 [Emergomyces africanus]|uniref:Uncharacterized protein n=1 Tax=Emergomyces africanus TaxID=1955775 RepID=A0A1B7P4H8_9EURO|nr:hypothetical protein ACJ72_01710 [Emergomyces africanus]